MRCSFTGDVTTGMAALYDDSVYFGKGTREKGRGITKVYVTKE
jgi:hypothetical protein